MRADAAQLQTLVFVSTSFLVLRAEDFSFTLKSARDESTTKRLTGVGKGKSSVLSFARWWCADTRDDQG